ncbi:unnamed protein product [Oppiella nova]|uniref:ABC-2 type transporter transmembrane domain-containing protein n=1 Tax=Oppiella nova TaxID=334625 RepID=A0A7R9QF89_9ACAR|nr:unnamed protein product [Oppiella nova]CAG2163819.1 unnamed protein product [Oppiella nova]
MVGLNADSTRFFTAMAIVILISQCAISYSYFMSCVTSSADTALKLGSLILTPIIMFGGYLLDKELTWVKYFYCLSWLNYGFEALVINEWNGVQFDDCPKGCNSTIPCISTGQEVIEDVLDFHVDHLGRNIWSCIVDHSDNHCDGHHRDAAVDDRITIF